jgi:uncharacterized protein YndB with AHSA1/START domain
MNQPATDPTIRKTITVEAPQARAFAVFADQMGSWWPLETHTTGSAKAQTVIVEPHAGGRWFERGIDGSECDWGSVIAYEPPARLLLNWQLGTEWRYDPEINTEVEIRFIAEAETRTRVEFEHRGLAEAYGDKAEGMHASFDGPGGWTDILDHYARATTA